MSSRNPTTHTGGEGAALELRSVSKRYRFFALDDVSFRLEPGQIMGFVGPNGAGKSTSMRILMGLVRADSGEARLLGHPMPQEQVAAKWDVGYVSEEMRLFGRATLAWHMRFVRSIYSSWDDAYAADLLRRFHLHPEQRVKGLSRGEQVKAVLLLTLARRPKLLVLDEPTSGLDPVARHEVIGELMEVLQDEERSILFSSHNTLDVEQISDRITFIDRGRIVDTDDKEAFLERWRRVHVDLPATVTPTLFPAGGDLPGVVDVARSGGLATVTSNDFRPALLEALREAGGTVREVQRMTLEEIFVANVMRQRRERGE
jgi:ABC-2 type transport system ATP-binding protein